MQWYHNKKCPWYFQFVTCPWHLEIVIPFPHLVSRFNSCTFFFSADLPKSPWWCLEPTLSFIGISVLLGWSMISFSEKGPLQTVGFLPLFLQGTLWIRHHNLNAQKWSSRQSPFVSIGQSHKSTGQFLHMVYIQSHSP